MARTEMSRDDDAWLDLLGHVNVAAFDVGPNHLTDSPSMDLYKTVPRSNGIDRRKSDVQSSQRTDDFDDDAQRVGS